MTTEEIVSLTSDDYDLIVALAGVKPCSLATSPGDDDNWIERAGGNLPNYICVVAKGILRSGKSRSAAIAIAVSRIKKWAAGGGDVDADTRAKAAKAAAQWAALKAKNSAKKMVKATHDNGETYFMLSAVSDIALEDVRYTWNKTRDTVREQIRELYGYDVADKVMPYAYVVEVYLTHIIIESEVPYDPSKPSYRFFKVPYAVTNGDQISFGDPEPVELLWVDEANDWKVKAKR